MPRPVAAANTATLLFLQVLAWLVALAVGSGDAIGMAVAVEASNDNGGSSNSCPAHYYSCASQGSQFDGICCPYDQVCALAGDNRPACCPLGAVCTGNAPSTYVTTTAAASYVPNGFYSFPYLLPAGIAATTALADINACAAVVQQCSRTFSQCTSALENSGSSSGSNNVGPGGDGDGDGDGDGRAITVVVAGSTTITKRGVLPTEAAGVKRAVIGNPTATLAAASAAGVCSSLSSQACGGLPSDAAACSTLFSGRAAQTGFLTGNVSTRQRRLPSLGAVVAIVAVVGTAMMIL
ncbi:uncharacterized protein SPSK_09593 [Sporothrix schenckii 1099-18]|uniref:Uncharacterized protein n=1 Tax=Sporothrix schenckii 1099-18 TaxID=1397361 RepID=A0A0F2M866_SPOSC|nr:uncharacterized protein SPSK_09593 [Sporothrix schenckii 1099-18]KJR85279.1 hypothetical protein SPSK_09593 [Sporothrix schenckii 1099-18]